MGVFTSTRLQYSDYIDFCNDLYRISSVISPRGIQKIIAHTFDGAQALTIYRSVKRSGIFV